MTVARATLFYCILCVVDGEKRECCRMCYDTATQTKTEDTAECRRQNNNIAEAITHKPIQYNKLL